MMVSVLFGICNHLASYVHFDSTIGIHVGFEEIFTSVDEDIGSFELCVRIFTEALFLPTTFEFSLDLISTADTAGTVTIEGILSYKYTRPISSI